MARDYKTKQQELILSCLQTMEEDEVTAAAIMARLRQQGAPIGLATIYRQLDKLVKAGRVCKYVPAEGTSACYHLVEEEHGHRNIQLECMDCGQSVNLPCGFLSELQHHLSEAHQFSIQPEQSVLYGRCKDCSDSQTCGK